MVVGIIATNAINADVPPLFSLSQFYLQKKPNQVSDKKVLPNY
jgi:hypothetical protein